MATSPVPPGARIDLAKPVPPSPRADASQPLGRDPYRGRLFRKYLLLILTLVTGALLASGGISLYFTYQETRAALANLQHEKAVAAAARIEQYVRTIEQQLRFAALPQLDAADVELRRIEFLKLLRQAPEVTDIAQLDPSGREQVTVSRLGMDVANSGKDRSQDPAFRNARRGQSWFGPVYFRKETEPYMTIAIRSGGENGAVTVADVNLKFIWDVVSRIRIGDKGKAYVVDNNGFLVADPDIGLVLRKTNLATLPHVKAAIAKEGSDELAMVSRDVAGTAVLASVASIDLLGWKVFVEQPVAEVYAKLDAAILRTGLLLLAGLAVSALGALALARGMVRPISTLSEGAQRIGAGVLDQKIDVRTGDELEALADRFNRMSAQLRESYAGLERKVEERTSELKNSLEQQTAISEILRVISGSPTDVQPVMSAVAERAAHLCDAPFAWVVLVENNTFRPSAVYAVGQRAGDRVRQPRRIERPVRAEENLHRRPRRDRLRDDPLRGHPPAARHRVSRRQGRPGAVRLPRHTGGAADARGRRLRRDPPVAPRGARVRRRSGGAGGNVRPSGGDRDRQRAPVQRNQGGAGPAASIGRSIERDQQLDRRHQARIRRAFSRAANACSRAISSASRWSETMECSKSAPMPAPAARN